MNLNALSVPRVAVVVAIVFGAACSSDSEPVEPEEVTVETFNVALAGSFIPFEQQRREALPAAIAESGADILCLQEVWTQQDKERIRSAVEVAFPYSVLFENDLDTPLDDPTDQNGNVPEAPTTVPCPEGNAEDIMDQAVDCAAESCNTLSPGDESGQTTSTECVVNNCFQSVVGLLGIPRCYACLATQLPTRTFAEIRQSCPTVVNQVLAFEGQNGILILSRYPLRDATNWVIPGTWNRRVITRATAELPNGVGLDVYCNHLTPIFDNLAFPYTGQYGEGATDAAGWEAEQQLQAQKLIDFVRRTSGDTPAIVLGDFNTGRAFPEQDIAAEGEPTLDLLESVFTPAYAADYVPQCTFCPDNPVVGGDPEDEPVWIDHIFSFNLASESTLTTSRTFDEDVVPVEPDGGGDPVLVPLSDHFGIRSVVRVP